jgi:hypothetical protein
MTIRRWTSACSLPAGGADPTSRTRSRRSASVRARVPAGGHGHLPRLDRPTGTGRSDPGRCRAAAGSEPVGHASGCVGRNTSAMTSAETVIAVIPRGARLQAGHVASPTRRSSDRRSISLRAARRAGQRRLRLARARRAHALGSARAWLSSGWAALCREFLAYFVAVRPQHGDYLVVAQGVDDGRRWQASFVIEEGVEP